MSGSRCISVLDEGGEEGSFADGLTKRLAAAVRSVNAIQDDGDMRLVSGLHEATTSIEQFLRRFVSFAAPTATSTAGAATRGDGQYSMVTDGLDEVLDRIDALEDHPMTPPAPAPPNMPEDKREGNLPLSSPSGGMRVGAGSDGGVPASQQAVDRRDNRPQQAWSPLIDNYRPRFVPRLLFKHHATAPLQPAILDAQREANTWPPQDCAAQKDGVGPPQATSRPGGGVALPHPYEVEVEELKKSYMRWQGRQSAGGGEGPADVKVHEELLREGEDGLHVAKPLDATPLVFVTNEDELKDMIQDIKTAVPKIISVDLEHTTRQTFRGYTCLIQISTTDRDYIIDPFDMFEEVHALNEVTADPAILKVFHGADNDVLWLQRDFSVYVVNMFDTGQAARVLQLPGGYSLANLLQFYCRVKADKSHQLADWRRRPLTPSMVEYARGDTHYLIYIFSVLKNELIQRAVEDKAAPRTLLSQTLIRSCDIAANSYVDEAADPSRDVARMLSRLPTAPSTNKGPSHFGGLSMQSYLTLFALVRWRDEMARAEDDQPHAILQDHQLFRIAKVAPSSSAELMTAIKPTPAAVRRHAASMLQVIQGALKDVDDAHVQLDQYAEPHAAAEPTPHAAVVQETPDTTPQASGAPVAAAAVPPSTSPAASPSGDVSTGSPRIHEEPLYQVVVRRGRVGAGHPIQSCIQISAAAGRRGKKRTWSEMTAGTFLLCNQ
uniref:HRDC domain-containing protein n=1 Tax=Vitrella brassicaformis TaxID=1169539 RepID=A0A7S1P175_9ALVE|mmetsp:Transcript_23589/g.58322  ORF Transcript_23589/g.58322 Transcript_23589/m.58322 type:complete len:720 (+) Transcript_23589:113-2272(+)